MSEKVFRTKSKNMFEFYSAIIDLLKANITPLTKTMIKTVFFEIINLKCPNINTPINNLESKNYTMTEKNQQHIVKTEAILYEKISDPILFTKDPVVSVYMLTYNHEFYITQAIEGVVMQETDFPIELVIGEDCSTDNTRKIVFAYQKRYPAIIKVIAWNENVGMKKNGRQTISECCGKYMAICEGDDYWTDPHKLQQQIIFLEKHENFSGIAHQSIVKYENNNTEDHFFRFVDKDIIKTEDLLSNRLFHTASFVFRTKIIEKNKIPANILSGDRCLFFLCSLSGPIKFLNKTMCIYRKSSSGISSWVTYDLLKKDLNMPYFLHKINSSFPRAQYLSFIHCTLITYPKIVTFRQFLKHYFFYLIYSFSVFPANLKEITLFTVRMIVRRFKKTKQPLTESPATDSKTFV